jgi:hypothetical protein
VLGLDRERVRGPHIRAQLPGGASFALLDHRTQDRGDLARAKLGGLALGVVGPRLENVYVKNAPHVAGGLAALALEVIDVGLQELAECALFHLACLALAFGELVRLARRFGAPLGVQALTQIALAAAVALGEVLGLVARLAKREASATVTRVRAESNRALLAAGLRVTEVKEPLAALCDAKHQAPGAATAECLGEPCARAQALALDLCVGEPRAARVKFAFHVASRCYSCPQGLRIGAAVCYMVATIRSANS